jgi:HTH-type transcriptional regulator, competence development regulator
VDFGTYIAELREKKGFSLRGLEKKAGDLSHVYIWRLEKGDRDAPSNETLDKLFTALGLDPREQELGRLLIRTEMPDELFQIARDQVEIPICDIEPVATMSFRGNRPTDRAGWLRLIDFVRDI